MFITKTNYCRNKDDSSQHCVTRIMTDGSGVNMWTNICTDDKDEDRGCANEDKKAFERGLFPCLRCNGDHAVYPSGCPNVRYKEEEYCCVGEVKANGYIDLETDPHCTSTNMVVCKASGKP